MKNLKKRITLNKVSIARLDSIDTNNVIAGRRLLTVKGFAENVCIPPQVAPSAINCNPDPVPATGIIVLGC